MKYVNFVGIFVLAFSLIGSQVAAQDTIACSDCDGKLDNLILRYDGGFPAFVEVDSRQGKRFASLFADTVGVGQQFSVSGSSNYLDKKSTLGPTIYLRVDGQSIGSLHTSCSQPIGPGTTLGDFVVIVASSRNGGLTCPVDEIPDPPCDPDAPPSDDESPCDGENPA
jgi:hypothetical protein